MTNPISKIDSGILTNASELIIKDLSSSYIKYVVEFNGLKSNTWADALLVCRLSTDNGATFISSSNAYSFLVQKAGGEGGTITRNIGKWEWSFLVQNISNTSGNFSSGSIEIYAPMDSGSRTKILCRSGGRIGDMGAHVQASETQRIASEANNAIRIFSNNDSPTEGNFSMKYAVYGYSA